MVVQTVQKLEKNQKRKNEILCNHKPPYKKVIITLNIKNMYIITIDIW